MTDTPDAEPPHADPGGPPTTVLEVQGDEHIPHRCFTPDVLREIHKLLSEGPFDEVQWEITDQQGVHKSANLDALLNGLLWPSVKGFKLYCFRTFPQKGYLVPLPSSVPNNCLLLWTQFGTQVIWTSAPENRQPVEFTFNRLMNLLRRLPASRASHPAFVDSLPVEAPPVESLPVEPTKAWWNPLRTPQSILDWIVVGLVYGLAVAAVVAAVALLARSL